VFTRPGVTRAEAFEWALALSAASLHPVSRAITAQAQTELPAHDSPFIEVRETAGQGLTAFYQGQEWRLGSARHCGLDETHLPPEALGADQVPCAFLVDQSGWVATFVLDEGLREDAMSTMAALDAQGLKIRLLSGDREAAVRRVAGLLGIQDALSQASPECKLAEVMRLQAAGIRLAMVGDGMNDGPVLARADCSFALGHGAPLTQARSDFVVQSGKLGEVADTIKQARATMRVVRQNLWWAAVYNVVSVPLALLGLMPPWLAGLGMAGSSLLVIGNAMRLSRPVSASVLAPEG